MEITKNQNSNKTKRFFVLVVSSSLPMICSILAIISFSIYIHGFDPAWSFLTIEAAIVWLIVSCLFFLGSCLLIVILIIKYCGSGKRLRK